jgi:hypothetical protein
MTNDRQSISTNGIPDDDDDDFDTTQYCCKESNLFRVKVPLPCPTLPFLSTI